MSTIGFIGLGHMGHPMCERLIEAGFSLNVYDINPDAMKSLEGLSVRVCQSPRDVAAGADFLITMLQTGEQVSSVMLGDQGVLSVIDEKTLYIDCSSIEVGACQAIHDTAKAKGRRMLDGPVSGGVLGAKAGTLTFMVGGEQADYQQALPILERMGKNIIHTGGPGTGQMAKICNNMLLGISMIGVCEGFHLAEKLGLSPEKLHEVVSSSSGQCWSMTSYCPYPGIMEGVPSNNHYKPGFTAAMMLKDLTLSQNASTQAEASTPMGALAKQIYAMYNEHGYSEKDFSGIIEFISGKRDDSQ